jgi:GTP-binding protein HflX
VRRVRFPLDREVVMLDTVGFIRDLPPALMQAFSATLEEVADADLLLHVIDATDADNVQQIATVERILAELGAGELDRFLVYNKVDRLPEGRLVPDAELAAGTFQVSALDRRSTRRLMDAIEDHLWARGKVDAPTAAAEIVESSPADVAAPERESEPGE